MRVTRNVIRGWPYDAIAFLVPHKEYLDAGMEGMVKAVKKGGVIFDLKSLLEGKEVVRSGRKYLAL